MQEPFRVTSIVEKWRFECPNGDVGEGHTNWFPIDGVFRCQGCAELARHNPTIEPEYRRLRDKKTGQLVDRKQIVLDLERRPAATGV